MLGVRPQLGRGFSPEDEKLGATRVVVISHAFWKRYFGGDPNIIGRQVTLADKPYTVTGVMPPGWKFPVQKKRSIGSHRSIRCSPGRPRTRSIAAARIFFRWSVE